MLLSYFGVPNLHTIGRMLFIKWGLENASDNWSVALEPWQDYFLSHCLTMTWWASCKDLVLLLCKVISGMVKLRICLSIVKSDPMKIQLLVPCMLCLE